MLAVADRHSQVAAAVDTGVLVLGGVCGAAFVAWLLRHGRWRNPLAGVTGSGGGPTLAATAAVVLLYLGSALALVNTLGAEPRAAPGTSGWHLAQAADAAARVLCAAVMAAILAYSRSFATTGRPGPGGWAIVPAGVLGSLIVTSACTLQLHMATIAWKWMNPGWIPPVHPVLLALKSSAWGGWGTLQLFAGAAVVTPVAEELFFRGLVLQSVWRYTRHAWVSVLVSAVAFGAVHNQPQDILPLCTMGVMLGYIRLRTRSLAACVLVHALFNARTMALAVFFPELLQGD